MSVFFCAFTLVLLLLFGIASAATVKAATPVCTVGAAGGALSSTLTWAETTTNLDGTPVAGTITYNVYEGSSATALGATPIVTGLTSPTYITTAGAAANSTVYFAVTEVEAGTESAQSLVACKTFPAEVPGAPTSLVVK